MKNLKDCLKLIFAAVMSFIVSLLPSKKIGENVPVDAIGKDVKERLAARKKVYGAADVSVAVKNVKEMIDGYLLFNRRRNRSGWKIHWHKPWFGKMTDAPGYYNTG